MLKETHLILASHNQGKVQELRNLLEPLGFTIEGLEKYKAFSINMEETGNTFEENARIKARAVFEATGKAALADDSGLIVDALSTKDLPNRPLWEARGLPGVHSARYHLEDPVFPLLPGETTDQANVRKLLTCLAHVPEKDRSARFVCAMALVLPLAGEAGGPRGTMCQEIVVESAWQGRIALAPRGTNGFGYDPVFIPKEEKGPHARHAAELTAEEKNSHSHRAKALKKLLKTWENWGF